MTDRPAYPRRPSHFAHRFVRVLHKSCAAQDIGQAACYMLCIIAHTEDAGRYAGPARFWNSQLMETLGFRSSKQLECARDRAVDAGWLAYNRGGTRSVGEYFVLIPERFAELNDAPLEPILSASGINDGKNNGKNDEAGRDGFIPQFFPNSEREGDGKRNAKVTESGKPPIPIPNSCRSVRSDETGPAKTKQPKAEYPEAFEEFWNAYPKRDGRRNGKGKSLKLWQAVAAADRPLVLQAAQAFSRSKLATDNKARDPERFLKDDWWRDWLSATDSNIAEPTSAYRDFSSNPRRSSTAASDSERAIA